jgi:ATP-dependent DNA helicase DinG
MLDALSRWGRASDRGDLTELDEFGEAHPLTGLVTSTADNCLGHNCEQIDRCFVAAARKRALNAQVVIVNHHLLLADLALREAGFGELLPRGDTVIVDEAHLLPDIAQQFFDLSLSSRELELLARDLTAEARLARSPGVEDLAGGLSRAALDTRAAGRRLQGRQPWSAASPAFHAALDELRGPLTELTTALAEFETAALVRCRERVESALTRLTAVIAADEAHGVRWLEFTERGFALHFTPLDVGAELRARVDEQGGAWIMTSATLAIGKDFSHFVDRIGIAPEFREVFASPFDYANNGCLYVPDGLPDPGQPDQTEALLAASWPIVDEIGGGAFFLFTSYRALHAAEQWFRSRTLPGPLLVQGARSRHSLLEEFRADGNAVLLGTSSFWQGVDVRGSALRLVVIDKLPFAAPNDPMVQARIQSIRQTGGDAFGEFQLPQAVLTLKQGVGRLNRDFDDRGIVVLGDARLNKRPYGRVFLDSLPPMPQARDLREVLEFARTLRQDAGRLASPQHAAVSGADF